MTQKARYIVDDEGNKQAVVLPVAEYEELMEDLHDLAVIAERRGEPTASWKEVRDRLKRNGVLPD